MQSSENNNKESSPAKHKIQVHAQAYEQKHSDFHGFTMCLKHAEVMFLDRKDFLYQALKHSEICLSVVTPGLWLLPTACQGKLNSGVLREFFHCFEIWLERKESRFEIRPSNNQRVLKGHRNLWSATKHEVTSQAGAFWIGTNGLRIGNRTDMFSKFCTYIQTSLLQEFPFLSHKKTSMARPWRNSKEKPFLQMIFRIVQENL